MKIRFKVISVLMLISLIADFLVLVIGSIDYTIHCSIDNNFLKNLSEWLIYGSIIYFILFLKLLFLWFFGFLGYFNKPETIIFYYYILIDLFTLFWWIEGIIIVTKINLECKQNHVNIYSITLFYLIFIFIRFFWIIGLIPVNIKLPIKNIYINLFESD